MARSVLVVDDISFVRKTLITILSDAGYQVVGEAEDGAQALKMYKSLQPDVVMMDAVMPKMSGIEATRAIMKLDKSAKVIVVSAMGQESVIMEAIHSGAKDYILKPFSKTDILRAIEHVLYSGENLKSFADSVRRS